jgi:predicted DNA-binding protein
MEKPSYILFCQDLREYLEKYIDVAKRYKRCCVYVLLRRMLRKDGRRKYHAPYAKNLRKLFSKYMFSRGTYIIPLEDAENILENIDTLCESLKPTKQYQYNEREKMEMVSIKLPKAMIEELDMYAKMKGLKRAKVVRMAVEEMLKKYKDVNYVALDAKS